MKTNKGNKMVKKTKRHKYWVEICESEYFVLAFPNEQAFLWRVENNAPILGGTVEVPLRTHKSLQKRFKKYAACSISWKKYAPQFGVKL